MDDEKGVEMPAKIISAYTVLLGGGDYGNSRQEVFAHTMDINSDYSFVPRSEEGKNKDENRKKIAKSSLM